MAGAGLAGEPGPATDVVVVPVPWGDDGPVAVASLWRRQGGRLRAGLAEVVTVEPPRRVVTRSIDGSGALTLTTTCDAMDGGCLVEQRLEGSAAGHAGERVAEFALLWLQRGLIDLKERIEADPGSAPGAGVLTTTGDRPQVERYASRLTSELGDLDAALGHSGLVPLTAEDSIAVAVPPAQPLLSPVLLPPPQLPVPAPVHPPAVDWDFFGLESIFGL